MARGIPRDYQPEQTRCPHCNALFYKRHPDQKYCSRYHSWRARAGLKPNVKRPPESEVFARAGQWLGARLKEQR